MLFLGEKLRISIFEDVLYDNSNAQNQHGHVQNTKDLLSSIFIVQISLYLNYLNEKKLLMVGVKRK